MFYCFPKYSLLSSIHFCMRLNQLSMQFCHSVGGILKKYAFRTSRTPQQVPKNINLLSLSLLSSNGFFTGSKLQLFCSLCESPHCRGEERLVGGALCWNNFCWIWLILRVFIQLTVVNFRTRVSNNSCWTIFFLQWNVHAVVNICWSH